MNLDSPSLELRLLTLLHQVREEHDEPSRIALNTLLRENAEARKLLPRLLVDEQVLLSQLREEGITQLIAPPVSTTKRSPRWFTWRPLTAAAAGIVFGMFCTSVVFGFVTQKASINRVPLALFNAGLESPIQPLHDGLPDGPNEWGMDDAQVVTAERGVSPAEGQQMMRFIPIPKDKDVKNPASRAYQVLDLRTFSIPPDAEIEVAASFCSENPDTSSRYLLRMIALEEAPEQALDLFWPKAQSDSVVGQSQRFNTVPGVPGWQRYSMRLRVPSDAKTLALVFGALCPDDPAQPPRVHYLDDVQVSVLTTETPQL
jgi:hypothetical protein